MNRRRHIIIICIIYLYTCFCIDVSPKEDRHGVKPPSLCEVCKLLSIEIHERLKETSSPELIETGYGLDKKKTFKYETSELRLREILDEPPICDRMHTYKLHKERTDSTRFAKGTPQTFKALNDLVKRGVDVKMDIPQELWDKPSAETMDLYKGCGNIVSEYEDDIETWYFAGQKEDLREFLCKNIILKHKSHQCLFEEYNPTAEESKKSEL